MRLTDKYGKGWSVATLKNAKKFYNVYSEKANSVYSIDNKKAKHCLANSKCETASLNVKCFSLPTLSSRQGLAASQG